MRTTEIVKKVKYFKTNKVVRYLLDTHPNCDLNLLGDLVDHSILPVKDFKEFYQLIGYSVDGYEEVFGK